MASGLAGCRDSFQGAQGLHLGPTAIPHLRKVLDGPILEVMPKLFRCQKKNVCYGNILGSAETL